MPRIGKDQRQEEIIQLKEQEMIDEHLGRL